MGTTPSNPKETLETEGSYNKSYLRGCKSSYESSEARDNPVEHHSVFKDYITAIINSPAFNLSYVRRLALLESIRNTEDITAIILEGILTCPRLSADDKNCVVTKGLLEHRWDEAFDAYRCQGLIVSFLNDDFLNYRRMILVLLRKSKKFQHLPETSRQRLKAMIIKTQKTHELNDLLMRVLERTCGAETQALIMEDMHSHRFHRLLWSDRFDCDEEEEQEKEDDRKIAAVEANRTAHLVNVYGSILLSDHISDQQDCCPICLDSIRAPALQLSCRHVFCTECISGWIRAEDKKSSGNTARTTSVSNEKEEWYCPVCRKSYERSKMSFE